MYQQGKRVTREELYEAVWSKTVKTLIKEWNTNYLQVNEACRRLQVPRPKPAYWQWMMRGRLIKRQPLRKPKKRLPAEIVLLSQIKSPLSVAVEAAQEGFDEERAQRERKEKAKQYEIQDREGEQRKIEEENRRRLEERSHAWWDARRLRGFIRECERSMRLKNEPPIPGGRHWLAWAHAHADRLDPMTNGYLEAERRRVAGS
jgi:hypothetical protein